MLNRCIIATVLLPGLLSTPGCRKSADAYVTIDGRRWDVELAVTDEQKYVGMSYRESAPDGQGMLFIYRQSQRLSFCMRGCLVPLDIAFIDENFRIVAIHTMEVEPDLAGRRPYRSGKPAMYALEVAAGALDGVTVGDTVTFSPAIQQRRDAP